MWTILDAAEFLDPFLAFAHRKKDGNFNINAISVYKVYIDFWIKILGRLFLNDKQIFTECFKSFLTLEALVVTKAHTYLNQTSQLEFACSKLTIGTQKHGVKYVQS